MREVLARLRAAIGFDSFADLTNVPVEAVSTAPDGRAVVRFADVLPPEVVEKVRARMEGLTPEDVALRDQARTAHTDNKTWVSDVLPVIESRAQAIVNHAQTSAADKELAKGVRAVADQVAALTRQVNVLIRLQAEDEGLV